MVITANVNQFQDMRQWFNIGDIHLFQCSDMLQDCIDLLCIEGTLLVCQTQFRQSGDLTDFCC